MTNQRQAIPSSVLRKCNFMEMLDIAEEARENNPKLLIDTIRYIRQELNIGEYERELLAEDDEAKQAVSDAISEMWNDEG